MVSKDQVLNMLAHIEDPELHRSLTDLNMVRDVQIGEGVVSITLALTVPDCPLKDKIEADVRQHIQHLIFGYHILLHEIDVRHVAWLDLNQASL